MPFHQGLTRVQGDPGFFSFLGGALKKVGGIVPGPIGTGFKAVGGLLAPGTKRPSVGTPTFTGAQPPPSIGGTMIQGPCPPARKRRRIDPLNIKALRRANTRQKAFLRAVDSTLKGMPTKAGVQRRRRHISGAKK